MTGRTLRIYLVDGSPTGVLTAEIMNWTGRVTVGPRSQLAAMATRPELSRTGIYLLVRPDPDVPNRDRVYVGEGDKVLTRLTESRRGRVEGLLDPDRGRHQQRQEPDQGPRQIT